MSRGITRMVLCLTALGWCSSGALAQEIAPGATLADARFRDAWARADVTIQSSCYCRKGS